MPIGVYLHKPLSEETKKKLSEIHKKIRHAGNFKHGHKPWNKNIKGIHLSSKSEWKKGFTPSGSILIKKGQFENEKHKLWKGNKVSYSGLHYWVSRKKGKPSKCEHCGVTEAKRFEWANRDGKYKRILDDFIRLCKPCHKRYDSNKDGLHRV